MRLALYGSAILLLLGILLRLTVGDRFDGLAILFYGTPWPILAGWAAVGAVACLLRRQKWLAVGFALASIGSAAVWTKSRVATPATQVAGNCRVVCWNAEHPKRLLPQIIAVAQAFDADLLGITETESTTPTDAAAWLDAFPGHHVETLPGFMLVISREPIRLLFSDSLGGRGRVNVFENQLRGRAVVCVFVEFDAAPWKSRRPAFIALRDVLAPLRGREILLMGDFNTPRESSYFDELRASFTHAFEAAGQGFAETWPLPFPVLSLDHVWTTGGLRATRCTLESSLSDHRAVIADFLVE